MIQSKLQDKNDNKEEGKMNILMKNTALLSFTVLILALGYSSGANAETTLEVDPPSQEVEIGQTATIQVVVKEVADLYAAQLKIKFDQAILDSPKAYKGDFPEGADSTFSEGENVEDANYPGLTKLMAVYLKGQVPGQSGSGTLLSIKFNTVNKGISAIELLDVILMDSKGDVIDASLANGQIEVTKYYTISINAPNGRVAKEPDLARYKEGTAVSLTATPDTGYNFKNWSGDVTGNDNPVDVTMDSDKTVTANFIGTAMVEVSPATQEVSKGEEADILIKIRDVADLYGFNLMLEYSDSCIEDIRAQYDPDFFLGDSVALTFTNGENIENPGTPGLTKLVGVSRLSVPDGVSGEGTLLKIMFRGKEAGTTPLNLVSVRLSDPTPEDIPFDVTSGEAVIKSDSIPPVITIISPADGDTLNVSPCLIRGIVTDDVSIINTIDVNGTTYPVYDGGYFPANAEISATGTTVTIVAKDDAGNEAEASLNLKLDAVCRLYGVYELALVPTAIYLDPLREVELEATFSAFSAEDTSILRRGFYDGEGIFKVRFTPRADKPYDFATISSEPSLNDIRGTFITEPSTKSGFIAVYNKGGFKFDDGSHYIPCSDTTLNLLNAADYSELVDYNEETGTAGMRMLLFNPDTDPGRRTWVFGGSYELPYYASYNYGLFRQLEEIIQYLDEKKMVCEIIFLSSNAAYIEEDILNDYLAYATTRLSAYPNLIFTIAIDYKDGFAADSVKRFGQTIDSNDTTYNHVLTVGSDDNFELTDEVWLDSITLRTYLDPSESVASYYGEKPVLTYLAEEDIDLEDDTRDGKNASTNLVRHDSIAAFMKGGYGSYACMHTIWDNIIRNAQDILLRIADRHIVNLTGYLRSIEDTTLLIPFTDNDPKYYLRKREDHTEYLGYLPEGIASMTIDMRPASDIFKLQWYDIVADKESIHSWIKGGEIRTFDSVYDNTSVLLHLSKVLLEGDANDDGIVDILDLVIVALAFGSEPDDPKWDSRADLNGDGSVDIMDLIRVAINFGRSR